MKQWFQIGKGVLQGYILSPCLFNLYAEYIMENAGLDEAQAGIKIDERNVNNLRYASLVTHLAKNPPAMQETWVQSLGWEDPVAEGMATHSSILALRIPMNQGAWWATVHGVTKSQT